jgi:hypothetical protein
MSDIRHFMNLSQHYNSQITVYNLFLRAITLRGIMAFMSPLFFFTKQ